MTRTFYFISIVLVILLSSCDKDEILNKQPSVPNLLSPENGNVIHTSDILFEWSESVDPEDDKIGYTLFLSTDSLNWKSFYSSNNEILITTTESSSIFFYPLEKNTICYWKVQAKNIFPGKDPNQEQTESISSIHHFFTSAHPVDNPTDSSGHEYVNLYWSDPVDMQYVEITFEPTVGSISQPIIIDKGVEKLELNGLENGTIYSFYIKSVNTLGHSSDYDTVKSMPLLPHQVHDADFNIYTTVKIGNQTWIKENLRTTCWQSGMPLKELYGAAVYYIGSKSDEYGYYYIPYTAFGEGAEGKNLCPCGYSVPSEEDWVELERYLGMSESDIEQSCTPSDYYRGAEENIGNMLKSSNGWQDYNGTNGNGTDLYGFSLLPAGYYDMYENKEIGVGTSTFLYSTSFKGGYIYGVRIFSNKSGGIRRCQTVLMAPIRCIKK